MNAPSNTENARVARPTPRMRRVPGRLLRRLREPVERFLRLEAASGALLLAAGVIGLAWANSPWAASYDALWHLELGLGRGRVAARETLHFWVNDGLMTIFFLLVGLEIRRELHDGELSGARKAALPVAAAVGGMVVPALLYLALAGEPPTRRGFGVPMATDIAFAVGVLTLLGKRVPPALRVLLLALAIIDDIGAILVIAFFYSSGIAPVGLAIAAAGVVLVLVFQRIGVRQAMPYALPALVMWAGLLQAGVHPTLAGVGLGLLTPVRSEDETPAPVTTIQARLHPWVAFGIMPLFALANAGVRIDSLELEDPLASSVALGVLLGLVTGKPLGIVLASWLAIRTGLCRLPAGVTFAGLAVMGVVAGIGFTMSMFIAELAFGGSSLLPTAKLSVLVASASAGALGLLAGSVALRARAPRDVIEPSDAEEAAPT